MLKCITISMFYFYFVLIRPIFAAKSRKDRKQKEMILLEGQRLINDAIDAGVDIKFLYFSKVCVINYKLIIQWCISNP